MCCHKIYFLFSASTSASEAVVTLAVIVSLLGLSILLLSAIFLLRYFRILPKVRARLVENTPYEDIVIPDQQPPETAPEPNHNEFRNVLYDGFFSYPLYFPEVFTFNEADPINIR